MLKHLSQKYANITTEAGELFKSYSLIVCQEKRKRPKTTGVVVRPILSREFNFRVQLDLIDMQSATDLFFTTQVITELRRFHDTIK